ncbi:hypothetical protein ACP275_14G211600 [Erythranthe tilingii]
MAAKSMVSYYKEVKSVFNKKMEFQTNLFNCWAKMFGKVYVSKPEEALRRCFCETRCSSILEKNKNELTCRVGLNRFSDITYDEFVKQNAGGWLQLPSDQVSSPISFLHNSIPSLITSQLQL